MVVKEDVVLLKHVDDCSSEKGQFVAWKSIVEDNSGDC